MEFSIRGVSERHDLYLAGHPRRMYVFDDGVGFIRDKQESTTQMFREVFADHFSTEA